MSAERAFDDLYSSLKPAFVKIVAGKLNITRDEADDLYNPAWEKVWVQERQGTVIEDYLSYLVTTGTRDFLMDRRKHGVRAINDGETALQTVDDLSDLVEDADMRRQIGLFAEAVQTLNPRYHEAVWLKYVHDYRPAEIVERTDLTERQVKRYIEAASKAMGPALRAIANGRWCEEQEVALLAYIRGETEPGDLLHAQAKRHLDNCPACRRRVRTQKGLAGVLPAPLLLSATAAAGTHGDGIFAGLRGAASAVRDALLGLVTRTPVATNPELVSGASNFTQVAKTAVAVCAAGAVCVPAAVVVSDSSLMPGHDKPKHAQAAKRKSAEKPLRTANASTTQPAPATSTAGLFAPAAQASQTSSQASGSSTASTTKPAGEFSLFNSFEQQAQEFSRQGGANFEKAAERSTFETGGSSSSKDSSSSRASGGSAKKKSANGGGSADQEFGGGSFETAPAPTTSASTGTSSSTTATAASTRALSAPAAPSAPAEFGSSAKATSGSFERGGGGFEGG